MPHKDDNPEKGYEHDIKKQPFQFTEDGFPKIYKGDKEYMECPQQNPMDQYADPQEVANAVHHYLDWLRAVNKRTWDNRDNPDAVKILELCQKGIFINTATLLHYDEKPERY